MSRKESVVIFLAVLSLGVLDQITKFWVFNSKFGDFLNALMPVVGKELFRNYDFAFSIPVPHVLMNIMYVCLLSALLFYFYIHKEKGMLFQLGIGLILCGALSNILDRYLYGYVRDFIYVFWGNIFNLADLYIIAGICVLLKEK